MTKKPNNMSLTLSYEAQRDLLTGMVYKRSNTTVATRSYAYDTLGRPSSRSTAKDGATVNDSFGYNSRSELSTATVNNAAYSYDYDNIGNRETTQEAAESATTYESNNLNQYTAIGDFEPTYDDAGNQTLVKTSTGIWSVVYDAENRPISFTNAESATVVECTYDYMGRRATKKVTINGAVTLHHRYLYRGYLQIACCDLTRAAHPCLWLITWDPTQAIATRPLAIQKDATWYTYGWDLTKNICEVFGQHGYIRTNYTYSPYGQVTATGDVTQPIQWSSEYHDTELALIYYNYRHYTPTDGRWLGRDRIDAFNLYAYVSNTVYVKIDYLGLWVNPKGDKVEWCAQKGDTLASLPRRANPKASFKDWECMWPIEGTKDHGYPTLIQPGDVYDASNVLTTHNNRVFIEMAPDLYEGHKANYNSIDSNWNIGENNTALDEFEVFNIIVRKSKEGSSPISFLLIGGHGIKLPGTDIYVGIGALNDDKFIPYLTADTIPSLEGRPIKGSHVGLYQGYDFAAKKNRRGPSRCWFSNNSEVKFVGCSTQTLAQNFARQLLRKGAKAWGTDRPIYHASAPKVGLKTYPPTLYYDDISPIDITPEQVAAVWHDYQGKN